MALMLVPLVGGIALGTEVSGWYSTQRSIQNAADAAAISAASNGSTTAPTYIDEARAVSARFGFTNAVNNTTVTAANNQTCPNAATNCYLVTISRDVPVRFVRLVGFSGNQNGGAAQRVTASAMASPLSANQEPCAIALGASGNGFRINGGPNFDGGGCAIESNAGATCNGVGGPNYFGIGSTSAIGTIRGNCGPAANQTTLSSQIPDPFSFLSSATNIPPPTGCSTGPISGPLTLDLSSGSKCYQGTLNITGGVVNVTTAPGGSILYIYGGNLNVASGATLRAAFGSGLTVVFTGPTGFTAVASNSVPGFLTGSGTFDWGAPTTGTWSGVAVYQDHSMQGSSSLTYSGNSPAFDLTGLVYAPFADMSMLGAINHQTGGYACLSIVANSILISGTGSLFANPTSECQRAGLILPLLPGGFHLRAQLVK